MYVPIAIAVVAFGVGFGLADRLADGRAAQREHAIAVAYAEERNAALETADREAKAELGRAVSAAASRNRKTTVVQEVIREVAADPAPAGCEWRPAHRLRLEALYRAYGYDPKTGAAGVPDPVPAAAPGGGAP